MCRVVLFDHLDAGAAVLRDLVDVCTIHQAHADVSVAQAVRTPPASFAVELQSELAKNCIHQLSRRTSWKENVRLAGLRPVAAALAKSLEGEHGVCRALAVSGAALSAYFDFQDRFLSGPILHDLHVPELQLRCLVWPQARIAEEDDVVVELLVFPFPAQRPAADARFDARAGSGN